MNDRQALECREKQILAPYAMCSQDSRGRQFAEAADPLRTAFQRDRDRIVHTNAFRRMADKTQVRTQPRGDLYRNRLTHSLEVAQIGRSMARTLGCNEDLVEAICLVHDLGHTPFGHPGEDVLNSLMKEVGGFDHQDYTYKLATYLEQRRPGQKGLNLTYEVREGIRKHNPQFTPSQALHYNPQERATLESQLANLADEIAYYSSDVDDFLRSRLGQDLATPFHGMANLKIFARLREQPAIAAMQDLDLSRTANRKRLISAMITYQVLDCLEVTSRNLAEAQVKSLADVRGHGTNLADNSSEMHTMHRELREFLYVHYFRHDDVRRWLEEGVEILVRVFKAYRDGPMERISRLPTWAGAESAPATAIGEYLASMTEQSLFRTALQLGVLGTLPVWYRDFAA